VTDELNNNCVIVMILIFISSYSSKKDNHYSNIHILLCKMKNMALKRKVTIQLRISKSLHKVGSQSISHLRLEHTFQRNGGYVPLGKFQPILFCQKE
jgi:hypothetical protein